MVGPLDPTAQPCIKHPLVSFLLTESLTITITINFVLQFLSQLVAGPRVACDNIFRIISLNLFFAI